VPVISPIVRKLAREAGLDLTRVAGTGPQGLVLRRDVNQAIAALGQPPAEIRIPIRGIRKAAAEKLTRSRREIPEATVWVDADAAGLLAARAQLAAQAPVSLLAVAARFALAGLRRYPELNAHLEGDEIVIPAHVHLGFAAQTERGLVVPVVRNAHLMPALELAAALGRQTAAARAGRLAPADLTGGTFTVNNYGVFGVDGSAAIINHPEVAILGLGRIIDRPWVVDGQLAVRKVTELTLAFDHRVCDGATAGGFLRYVADRVESPALALETVGLWERGASGPDLPARMGDRCSIAHPGRRRPRSRC
jgi:pyruvate dehydrogenase E2 component (dihydrolipoamide acetyltransferase)